MVNAIVVQRLQPSQPQYLTIENLQSYDAFPTIGSGELNCSQNSVIDSNKSNLE